jgi:hypothetical protein
MDMWVNRVRLYGRNDDVYSRHVPSIRSWSEYSQGLKLKRRR